MATDVDICNTALGYLGDSGTVASINPPEGSAQAEHCARYYAQCRDTLLEMHAWGFSTARVSLAQLSETPPSSWAYVYAAPNDALNYLAVLNPDAVDDYSFSSPLPYSDYYTPDAAIGYSPQPYSAEVDSTNTSVIYTNQQNAVLRYTRRVTDPTQFSPLFTEALCWLLASKLAGPVIKGEAGAAMAQRCYQMFSAIFARATVSDANQRNIKPRIRTPWIVNR